MICAWCGERPIVWTGHRYEIQLQDMTWEPACGPCYREESKFKGALIRKDGVTMRVDNNAEEE